MIITNDDHKTALTTAAIRVDVLITCHFTQHTQLRVTCNGAIVGKLSLLTSAI